jgi:signal transduction histidine kinase
MLAGAISDSYTQVLAIPRRGIVYAPWSGGRAVGRLRFFDSLGTAPHRLQLVLDVTAIFLAAAAFLGLGEPDVLFHGVWVCLVLEAFLFGGRSTLVRIAAATVVVLAYATMADFRAFAAPVIQFQALWSSEWPLMVVIAVIVALMADRVVTTGRRYAALYREASDRLLTAQEDERNRLARDLHDGVGQTLTGLLFTLDAVDSMVWPDADDGTDPPARATLHKAQDLASTALRETRDVSFRLRPARLEQGGLAAAIRELAQKVGRPVEIRIDPEVSRPHLLDVDREIEVYRIVQESLGNAMRHAAAPTIWLSLDGRPDALVVHVGDDGRGFDPGQTDHAGLGLAGMRERAHMLRADLTVQSAPGRGTVIELTVPWSASGPMSVATAATVAHPVA